MTKWNTVAIVGVGLIGGSIGLTLRRRGLVQKVIGVGRNPATLALAQKLGAIDEALPLPEAAAAAEMVIICTPVDTIASIACEALRHCGRGAIVTDAGSTKAEILAAIDLQLASQPSQGAFIGSHPMAGKEQGGVESADDKLFEGRTVILTPNALTDAAALEQTRQFWESLGCRTADLSPGDHDAIVSSISHLPHLAASAAAALPAAEALPFAAGGFDDTTRIAEINLQVWPAIFAQNRACVLADLDRYLARLGEFRTALTQADDDLLRRLLQAGIDNLNRRKEYRDAVGS
ncbi:prephenate dehydrogenase [Lignipirellula cremea]|uniref:Prephenate dehydrogenase n=1 Tax=Lignipirellula cremea TaxID=2528010 RepID=A0A518DYP6_9BACT|nr:prephenate dehydrogenase [Lignipirellula cremea]QDU96967.1 prephenate dehydrogenase [Lignipirellula cremea]